MVYDPHQEDQGGEKGAADCIFFLELYQYILDIFISLLLKAEPLAPVGRSVYRGETLGFCQEGVQVFHHHQLRVTSCLCGKIGQSGHNNPFISDSVPNCCHVPKVYSIFPTCVLLTFTKV